MRSCGAGRLSGAFLLCVVAGCDAGTLRVTTTPAFFRDDVPRPEVPPDGQLELLSSLFCIAELRFDGDDGAVGGAFEGGAVFGFAQGPSEVTTFEGLAPRRYERASFTIGPATFATAAGNVDSPELERMQAQGLSHYALGIVHVDELRSVLFEVELATETLYDDCADADGQPGVEVVAGEPRTWDVTTSFERTLGNAELGFDAGAFRDAVIAADVDGDGRVGMDEIDAFVLDSGVTFGDQLRGQSATIVGHNGLGTCTSRVRP